MSYVIILSLKKFLVSLKFVLILKQQKSPGGSGSQTVDYLRFVLQRRLKYTYDSLYFLTNPVLYI